MNHASIFSGIGGFDLAAEWAGWTNAFNCEIDPFCRKILKYYFPNATQYDDIRTTDFSVWRGRIDVLTGGFPCQPFSISGRRKGADDNRYLWPQMLRAITEIRPTWVIGENVAGILSMVQSGCDVEVAAQTSLFDESCTQTEERQQYIVETVCRDFESIGYSVQPVLIPACGIGAPHRRDRCWFVAHHSDTGEWENGVPAAGNATDADGHGCRYGADQSELISRSNGTSDACVSGKNGTAADTACIGCEQGRTTGIGTLQNTEIGTNIYVAAERFGRKWIAADTKSQRFPERDAEQSRNEPYAATERHSCVPNWKNFPTQCPVCSRDDGLSYQLDGITFSKWRRESIKGLGNAIVPQIAYEIFKAINEYEGLSI